MLWAKKNLPETKQEQIPALKILFLLDNKAKIKTKLPNLDTIKIQV